jgi:hypothetical protein
MKSAQWSAVLPALFLLNGCGTPPPPPIVIPAPNVTVMPGAGGSAPVAASPVLAPGNEKALPRVTVRLPVCSEAVMREWDQLIKALTESGRTNEPGRSMDRCSFVAFVERELRHFLDRNANVECMMVSSNPYKEELFDVSEMEVQLGAMLKNLKDLCANPAPGPTPLPSPSPRT